MLDIKQFFQATNPAKALFADKKNHERDRQYYIDFSSVRGGEVIDDLKDNITLWSPNEPTCQLFTGHIGCGKSTELFRLQKALEKESFQVVYFDSGEDLEMVDVDVTDILLAIARHVSNNLDELKKEQPKNVQQIIKQVATLLQTEIELSTEVKVPGMGQVSATTEGKFSFKVGIPGLGEVTVDSEKGLSLATLIGTITAQAKASPDLRSKLRGYLEPRTKSIIDAINSELLKPATEELSNYRKQGLVVIIDSLDKIHNTAKPWGRSQHEYLFVDRAEQLASLQCHLIYTIPLSLRFSNDFETMTQRFLKDPKVLPMIPIKLPNGEECQEGMELLRKMILARAFPDVEEQKRRDKIKEIFDCEETLAHLCRMSGGHVRNILRLLNDAIKKGKKLPVSRASLDEVIKDYRRERLLAVDPEERKLLQKVAEEKKVRGDRGYQTLIRSMFVYEYRYQDENWFEVNPIIAE